MDLLERHRSALAKNPPDKVFAFLGLSRQIRGRDAQIVEDYGLSPEQLYTAVTTRAMEVMPTLDVLSYPHIRVRQDPLEKESEGVKKLPSWVIDWTDGDEQDLYGNFPALDGCERV
jgi:hypothetical protein